MKKNISIRRSPRPHELKIRAVLGHDLDKKIHDAVAWRAFQFYEQQGCLAGHDVEHWRRAWEEAVRPLECGVIAQDHRVCLTADTSLFDDEPIEIYVEPRRLTLCGFDRHHRQVPPAPGSEAARAPRPRKDWIFHVHEFDVEVDPRQVTARFNGPVLNIYLAKVGSHAEETAMAAAR